VGCAANSRSQDAAIDATETCFILKNWEDRERLELISRSVDVDTACSVLGLLEARKMIGMLICPRSWDAARRSYHRGAVHWET
jgi:hypothetical protein